VRWYGEIMRQELRKVAAEATMFMKRKLVRGDSGQIKGCRVNAKSFRISRLARESQNTETIKMLKMKDDPTISMKTQGRATNCPT
jgi:hypothetical protein